MFIICWISYHKHQEYIKFRSGNLNYFKILANCIIGMVPEALDLDISKCILTWKQLDRFKNKRPMGHIAQDFKIFSIYFGEGHGPSFEQTWIPSTQGSFVPSLVEIGPMLLKKILKIFSI